MSKLNVLDCEIGMRVMLVNDTITATPRNPVLGSEHECFGTIIHVNKNERPKIHVLWDNGHDSLYISGSLALIPTERDQCISIWNDV